MPNNFAYLVLIAWPIITLYAFKRLPLQIAVLVAILGGYMWLPQVAAFDAPLLPKIDRAAAPALTVALLVLIGYGAANRRALRREVEGGSVPGLLAYAGREPVGWCALAPRETYGTLGRSRILKPVDDREVWSVVCFFIAKEHRGAGVGTALLKAAVDHARRQGARCLEGYPVEPKKGRMPEVFAFTGIASIFRRAGFREVARRSETRPIFRRNLRPG